MKIQEVEPTKKTLTYDDAKPGDVMVIDGCAVLRIKEWTNDSMGRRERIIGVCLGTYTPWARDHEDAISDIVPSEMATLTLQRVPR